MEKKCCDKDICVTKDLTFQMLVDERMLKVFINI